MIILLLVFLLSMVAALLLTPVSKLVAARIGAMDEPGELKVHGKATPRFGGSAICVATIIGCLAAAAPAAVSLDARGLAVVLTGATLIAIVGAVDDVRGLSPKLRLVLGLLISGLTAALGLETWSVGMGLGLSAALALLFVLWLVGSANAMNMLDGLDGLAAGAAAIAGIGIATIAIIGGSGSINTGACAIMAIAVAGACVGFLPYNFRPASTFMGDVGSLFLGFVLASCPLLLLRGWLMFPLDTNPLPLFFGAMVALGLPVMDMMLALIRRMVNHKPVFTGDRSHFYDQLRHRLGFSVVKTVLICYVVAAVFAGLGVVISTLTPYTAGMAVLAVIVIAAILLIASGFVGREETDEVAT